MIKYVVRRLLLMIPILIGVMFLVFTINFISPTDPAAAKLGAAATAEQVEAQRVAMGLDKPYIVQLWNYIKDVVFRLDLGESYANGKPVMQLILERFPTTVKLGVFAIIFAVSIGVPVGVISAVKQYSVFDLGATTVALAGAAMPSFWLGLMMILVFSLRLGWLPSSGIGSPEAWIMPVIAVGVAPVATIMRTTRSCMLEVIRQDYIRTVRAKGASEARVIINHALKNSLIPIITVIGIQMGFIFGGVMVVEAVFAVPGLGALMQTAIGNNDYPLIQGCVLFCAAIVCVCTLLVDIIYAFVDPTIKAQYTGGKKMRRLKNGGGVL